MTSTVTLLTDGSAEARAMASWLAGKIEHARIYEARSTADVSRVLAARRASGRGERIVVLSDRWSGQDAIGGSEAMLSVTNWLSDLAPIDARAFGAERISERFQESAPGSAAVESLVRTLVLATNRAVLPRRTGRLGRRPGSNPFRGVGFDLCTLLLLEPGFDWPERELASRIDRDPAAVHRVLVELARRGLVTKAARGTRLLEPELLRDDLLASWRGTVGAPREARDFSLKAAGDGIKELLWITTHLGRRCLLAGHAAVPNPSLARSGPRPVYLEGDWQDLGKSFEKGKRSFEEAAPGLGDVTIWTTPERGVFLFPGEVRGLQTTNAVVTYLDLAVADSPRSRVAAQAVWEGVVGARAET